MHFINNCSNIYFRIAQYNESHLCQKLSIIDFPYVYRLSNIGTSICTRSQICVFTFLVLCSDLRSKFRIKKIFGLSLPPVVCRRPHVLFMLFVFACAQWCPTCIDYASSMLLFYQRQELLTLHEHLDSPSVFGGIHIAHHFRFLCGIFVSVFVLCPVYPIFPVSLDCPFLIAPVFSNVYSLSLII